MNDLNNDFKEKIEACNAILCRLCPDSDVVVIWTREIFSDNYILSIHNHNHERLAYLKISMIREELTDNLIIHSIQLYKDFVYQVDFGGENFGWFLNDSYTKPDNYQEIKDILKQIWNIIS